MSRNRSPAFGNETNIPIELRENVDDTINGVILRLNRVFFKDDAEMKRRFLENGILKHNDDGKLKIVEPTSREQLEAAFGKSHATIQRLLKENQTKWNTLYPLPDRYLRAACDYIIYGKDYLNWNDMMDKQMWSGNPEPGVHIIWNCNEVPEFPEEINNVLQLAIGDGEYTFLPYGISAALRVNDALWTYPILRKFIREGRFLDASPIVKESLLRADPALARIAQIRSEARNLPKFKENLPTRRFRVPIGSRPVRTTRRARRRS